MQSSESGFARCIPTSGDSTADWRPNARPQKLDEAVRARPEAWMAVNAICNGMKCCQSYLGPRTAQRAGGPDIVETIRQTVGNLFWCCDAFEDHWLDRDRHRERADVWLGPRSDIARMRQPDKTESFELFRSGVRDLHDQVLKPILAPDTLAQLKETAALRISTIFISVRNSGFGSCMTLLAAYHRSTIARDHVLQALVPLYRGQLFSFLAEHAHSTPEEMEADTEALCLEFERRSLT